MSLSLPPSYTTNVPGYASTSGSNCSCSSRRRNSHSSRKSPPEVVDDDNRSIASGHSACTARTHQSSRSGALIKLAIRTDIKTTTAGSVKGSTKGSSTSGPKLVVRRAKCPPEYLEEIAKSGVPHGFKTRAESTFKIVSGSEAEKLFDQFVKARGQECVDQLKSHAVKGHDPRSGPVVFAISLLDAGRRVVDYYMSWRGQIPRVRDGRERRLSFLDSEFRRVARSLDKHYKSIISIIDNASPVSEHVRKQDEHKRPETPPPEPPPKDEPPQSPSAASATASVVSLPLLNMIRNVPFGNRQTLRVTNPDTASILSADDAPARVGRVLDTIAEGVETTIAPPTESPTSVVAGSPSQADRRNREYRSKPRAQKHTPSAPSSPEREKKRANTGDGQSRRSHKHKRDGDRKHRSDDDGHPKRSPPNKRHHHKHKERKHDSDTDHDEASEFTIVLLDDNAEKDLSSWHGLNRVDVHNTPRSSNSTLVDSPWTGPLVNANRIIFHSGPHSASAAVEERFSEDESDDDDDDSYEYEARVIHNGTPGSHHFTSPAPSVPIALSYAGSSASTYSTSSSGKSTTSISSIGRPASRASSMASYSTAYTYPTHRMSTPASSYVPAWINPRHYVTPGTPLTRIQTPLSYHSGSPGY